MLKTNQTKILEMKQMVNQIKKKPQQMALLTDKSMPKKEFQGWETKSSLLYKQTQIRGN